VRPDRRADADGGSMSVAAVVVVIVLIGIAVKVGINRLSEHLDRIEREDTDE
jgi:hypothetical protein